MAIFGTSIGLLSLLGLRIKHKPSILGSDVSLAIYAFWISVNHLFHLYHIFTLLLNKHYLLWCTWHVPFPSPPAQRIPSVKLSPFAFIFLLHLVFEAIWTYEKYIWIECLEKKLQPWLLGEHQSNSLLPSPQVPILNKKLQYTSHTTNHLIKHVICVGS